MWFKMKRKDFEMRKGDGNKKAMRKIIRDGVVPGILAYVDGVPVGWCAVEPRVKYSALERSRILKPVDDAPVWSIPCLFVAKAFRKKGLSAKLLKAAVDYVASRGGKIVEGYPVEPKKSAMPDVFMYHGLASAFLKAGFREVERRSETRPIMRFTIKSA